MRGPCCAFVATCASRLLPLEGCAVPSLGGRPRLARELLAGREHARPVRMPASYICSCLSQAGHECGSAAAAPAPAHRQQLPVLRRARTVHFFVTARQVHVRLSQKAIEGGPGRGGTARGPGKGGGAGAGAAFQGGPGGHARVQGSRSGETVEVVTGDTHGPWRAGKGGTVQYASAKRATSWT